MATSPIWASRPKTRGLVLDLIRAARTISRVELAAATGLTGADHLRGRARADRRRPGRRGRPGCADRRQATACWCSSTRRPATASGSSSNATRASSSSSTWPGGRWPGPRSSGAASMPPERALPLVAAQVDALLATAAVDRDKVLGVGLVSYGPQDRRAGVLLTPQPTDEWLGYPVAQRLAESLGLPVLLDNDAAAAAIGEYWMGAVDPRSTYGCIYMATGIGGGVVVAGEVYRGSSSNSVEIGHISIDVNGDECPCGNVGCLENYAGPSAVVRQALATPGLAQRLALDPAGGRLPDRVRADRGRRERRRSRRPGPDRTVGPLPRLCRRHHDQPVRSRRDRAGRAELRGGRLDLPVGDPAGGGPPHVRPAGASGAGRAVGQRVGRGRDRRGGPRPAERAHPRRIPAPRTGRGRCPPARARRPDPPYRCSHGGRCIDRRQ